MKRRAKKVVGPDGFLYPEGTTFSDVPRPPAEIASDANLSLAALNNQLRAEQDDADDYTMTAAKLAEKLPGMMAGPSQLDDPTYAFKFRQDDEEILKAEQAAYREGTMQQEIRQNHRLDLDGNPAGGSTSGRGISIHWQDGPLADSEGGTRKEPNGAFVEGVILAAKGRLEHYQEGKFACPENASAIAHLEQALLMLELRTLHREERGVEGTHEV